MARSLAISDRDGLDLAAAQECAIEFDTRNPLSIIVKFLNKGNPETEPLNKVFDLGIHPRGGLGTGCLCSSTSNLLPKPHRHVLGIIFGRSS